MFPRVKQVRHLGQNRLELSFTDGTKGKLDFEHRVLGRGGIFSPLEGKRKTNPSPRDHLRLAAHRAGVS